MNIPFNNLEAMMSLFLVFERQKQQKTANQECYFPPAAFPVVTASVPTGN